MTLVDIMLELAEGTLTVGSKKSAEGVTFEITKENHLIISSGSECRDLGLLLSLNPGKNDTRLN